MVQKQEINKLEQNPSWKRATTDERGDFFKELDRKLKSCDAQNELLSCRNAYCQNDNHKTACDDYMLDILHKMEQTASETLPPPIASDPPPPPVNLFQGGMKISSRIEKMLCSDTQFGCQQEDH